MAGGSDSLTSRGARGAGMSTAFPGGPEGRWCRGAVGNCAGSQPPERLPPTAGHGEQVLRGSAAPLEACSGGESVHGSLAGFDCSSTTAPA